MKKTSIKSPVKLLLTIVDDGVGDLLEKYYNERNLTGGLVFKGKGTAESEIADLFGFGLSDKDIVAIFVPSDCEDIVNDVNEITGIERDSYGLNMVLEINSASSNLLDGLGIKL